MIIKWLVTLFYVTLILIVIILNWKFNLISIILVIIKSTIIVDNNIILNNEKKAYKFQRNWKNI